MNDIKETLMRDARECGICLDGYEQMRVSDRDSLIDYYVSNPDWCLERGYPSLAVLRKNFKDCEDKGVYVDKEFKGEEFSAKQAYVFHNCRGTIYVAMDYANAVIPMMYFGNGCRVIVKCKQAENKRRAIHVPIYEFGANEVQARSTQLVKFHRFKRAMK